MYGPGSDASRRRIDQAADGVAAHSVFTRAKWAAWTIVVSGRAFTGMP